MGRKKRYTGLYGMPFGGAFGGAYGGGGGAGAGYGASSAPLFGASSAPTLGSLLAAPEPAGPDVPELPEHKVVGVTFNNRQGERQLRIRDATAHRCSAHARGGVGDVSIAAHTGGRMRASGCA